jgi:hypothetical protein
MADQEKQEPQVLSINVGDSVKSGESMGKTPQNLFPNPKNDPNIAGVAGVQNLDQLQKIGPVALEESKRLGKPVILIVKG